MKPGLAIFANVYVLIAKIVDPIAAVAAKYPLPIGTSLSKPQPARLILLLGLVLGASPTDSAAQKYGTAILVIRTPNEIVAAADSVETDREGNPVGTTCKIREFGKFYVVVNGMESSPPADFDAFYILKETSQIKGDVLDMIKRFEQAVKPKLERAFEAEGPENRLFGATFMGFKQGVPFVIGRRAVVTSAVGKPVTIEFERPSCPGDVCGKEGFAALFVPKGSKARFEREHPDYFRGDLVVATRAFVQMNIDIKHRGVGPPIDILRITTKGAQWIKRKPECEEKKETTKPKPTATRRRRRSSPR